MRSHRVFVVGLLVCVGSPAVAQTTRIEHQGVACAVAERFPRLEAGVSPIKSVAIARVLFQGTSREWYSVAMKVEGGSLVGVLPKPKKSLKAFRYYIEVTDKALGTTRTPEFSTTVIESSGACKGGILAGALGSASVVLQGPAGIAAIPAGFASTGVVAGTAAGSSTGAAGAGAAGVAGAAAAAGGGLSGAAVVGIVGAGVAVAGVAVAAGGGENSSSPGASPTPTPGPSSTSYTGPFSAQMFIQFIYASGSTSGCQTTTSTHIGTLTMTLQQTSGGTTSGTTSVRGTRLVIANTGSCGGEGNVVGDTRAIVWTVPVTGSAGNLAFSAQNGAETISFIGVANGGAVTGTFTLTHSLSVYGVSQAGTVSVPVTLR